MPETSDRLRGDIDAGRTGDKVAASDPAMAPLGTDDEAGGSAPSADAVAEARCREISAAAPPPEYGKGLGYSWVLISLTAMFAVAVIAGALILR